MVCIRLSCPRSLASALYARTKLRTPVTFTELFPVVPGLLSSQALKPENKDSKHACMASRDSENEGLNQEVAAAKLAAYAR